MPAHVGNAFTPLQAHDIERAIADADRVSGATFSVFVGSSGGDPRGYAEGLHRRLADPDRSVLILVDPSIRQLEIVTGPVVGRTLDNRQAALAAITMQSAFATGDLFRGLLNGLQQLAGHARTANTLHTDTP